MKAPYPLGSTRRNSFPEWVTVAVIPAPAGVVNSYAVDAPKHMESRQCPAFLLQELRSYTFAWDLPEGERHSATVLEDAPFETRVTAAEFDGGDLSPADELSNYRGADFAVQKREQPDVPSGSTAS
jgi:hypothetical protein